MGRLGGCLSAVGEPGDQPSYLGEAEPLPVSPLGLAGRAGMHERAMGQDRVAVPSGVAADLVVVQWPGDTAAGDHPVPAVLAMPAPDRNACPVMMCRPGVPVPQERRFPPCLDRPGKRPCTGRSIAQRVTTVSPTGVHDVESVRLLQLGPPAVAEAKAATAITHRNGTRSATARRVIALATVVWGAKPTLSSPPTRRPGSFPSARGRCQSPAALRSLDGHRGGPTILSSSVRRHVGAAEPVSSPP